MEDQKELISLETLKPDVIFKNEESIQKLIDQLKKVAVPKLDANTDEGREERRSLAYKIAQTKTGVDGLGKDYVADLKKVTKAIDERRAKWRKDIEEYQHEVRLPLTEYENKEKERKHNHNLGLQNMRDTMNFDFEPDAAAVGERIAMLEKYYNRNYEEFSDQAKTVYENAEGRLGEKLASVIKAEEDAAELERLRKEKEEFEREKERAEIRAQAERDAAAKYAPQSTPPTDPLDNIAPPQQDSLDIQVQNVQPENSQRERNRAIVKAMVEHCMISESAAKAIVTAILKNQIPHTFIK
jgi:hypothetical protein